MISLMTPHQFRRLALSMPQAVEHEHMGHPDFRAHGKIFATLFTRDDVMFGMVKLKPSQQKSLLAECPEIFTPVKGAWGRQGCTQVRLDSVDRAMVPILREAIHTAWSNVADQPVKSKRKRRA